jgi:hypothetical protein
VCLCIGCLPGKKMCLLSMDEEVVGDDSIS